MSLPDGIPIRVIGRYAIHEEIASGGMATVHFGRLVSAGGFSRTVAIKRLHAHLARDPEFVKMFLDEARIAARIRHPNVVPVLDVVNTEGEIFLVMEYVAGESLALLARAVRDRGERIPFPVAAALVVGVLRGLHAAHEATDERGQPLCIVHRDVSPQNVLVGRDGVAHLLDFGVAKAEGQLQTTREGRIKGKVGYMPPEQARGGEVTRAVDIYAAGVVLWELSTGERLFAGDNDAIVLERVLFGEIAAPSSKGAPAELDEVVMRALGKAPESRFSTAREMARAIEAAIDVASGAEVTEWLETQAGALLEDRRRRAAALAQSSDGDGSGVRPSAGLAAREATHPAPRAPSLLRRALVVMLVVGGLAGVVLIEARRTRTAAVPTAPSIAVMAEVPGPVAPPSVGAPAPSAPLQPVPVASTRPAAGRPPARPRPSAAAAGCNPPYTIGADGVKQYKVQCL